MRKKGKTGKAEWIPDQVGDDKGLGRKGKQRGGKGGATVSKNRLDSRLRGNDTLFTTHLRGNGKTPGGASATAKVTHREMVRNYVEMPEKPIYTSMMVAKATLISENTVRHYLADLAAAGVISRMGKRVNRQICYRTVEEREQSVQSVGQTDYHGWVGRREILERIYQVVPNYGWYTAAQVIALSGIQERSMYRYLQIAVYMGVLLVHEAGLDHLKNRYVYGRGIGLEGDEELPEYRTVMNAWNRMEIKTRGKR